MRKLILIATALFCTAFSLPTLAESKDQQRAEIRTTSQAILNKLYKVQPASRGVIANAAGYGVFSNFGMKIFVAGGGTALWIFRGRPLSRCGQFGTGGGSVRSAQTGTSASPA